MHYLLITILFLLTAIPSAHAHSPYRQNRQEVRDEQGRFFFIEEFYGDGIFWVDPMRVQVVDGHNRIYASTPQGSRGEIFCPKITSCYALIYNGFSISGELLRLSTPIQSIITDPAFDHYEPYGWNEKSYGFHEPYRPIIRLMIGMIWIAIDCWFLLPVMAGFILAFWGLKRFVRGAIKADMRKRIFGILIALILFTGYVLVALLAFYMALPLYGVPVFYMILAFIVARQLLKIIARFKCNQLET
jgi:hypothetical protein